MTLSGFTWPTAANKPNKPVESMPTTSAASVDVSSAQVPVPSHSGESAAETTNVQLTLTTTVTPSSVAPSAEVSALPVVSDGPRTTHVQVTRTVTVQPTPTAAPSPVSTPCSHPNGPIQSADSLLTTRIQVTQTTTVYPAAPTLSSSIAFQLAELPPDLAAQFTPPPQATTPTAPVNNAAIAGGIIGGIIGVAALLVLVRWLQKRTPYVDIERQPRRDASAPFPQRLGQAVPMGHLSPGRANHRNADGVDPVALAQAMGWQTPFAADNFARTPVRGGGTFPGPSYPAPAPAQGGRRGYSVSPLSDDGAQPRAGNDRYSVSPL